MSDGTTLRLRATDAQRPTSGRPLSATALTTLTAETARHPGPKTVLIGEATAQVTEHVLDQLMPADQLVACPANRMYAAELRSRLTRDRQRFADRVKVVGDLAEVDDKSIDVAIAAAPLDGDTDDVNDTLDSYRALLRSDGVLSVSTPVRVKGSEAATALAEAAATHGVRADLVLRSRRPLRVHHLRFTPADPALAERLGPAESPSHVPVTRRMGIDSNGVAAAAILGGAAAVAKLVRPRSKAWIVPAVAALPVAAFFRDPRRITPADPSAIVAASDGLVLSVERLHDERFGPDEWLRIAVFLSVLDVHVNRSPVSGRVVEIICEDGGYAMAQSAGAEHNVAQYTVLETTHGRVVVAQRTGLIARRIVNRSRVGSLLTRGERYGLIRFGSRTDVYLPADAVEATVAPGDRVTGAETIIATYR
jgi:phosphatidylserine decarboxylase